MEPEEQWSAAPTALADGADRQFEGAEVATPDAPKGEGPEIPAHVEAHTALSDLKCALTAAGITLPSLWVGCPPVDGVHLIKLGSVRPDVVAELTAVIRKGTEA